MSQHHRRHHRQPESTTARQEWRPADRAPRNEPIPHSAMFYVSVVAKTYMPVVLAIFILNCTLVLTEYRKPGLLTSLWPLRNLPKRDWAVYTLVLLPFWLWSVPVCIFVNAAVERAPANNRSLWSLGGPVSLITIKLGYVLYNIVPIYVLLSRCVPAVDRAVFQDASILLCHRVLGNPMLTCYAPWGLATFSDLFW